MGEDEAGTAKAVREHREAAHPITLKANYGFPPTATSTVTNFNDRLTSTPAVCSAQRAVVRRRRGERVPAQGGTALDRAIDRDASLSRPGVIQGGDNKTRRKVLKSNWRSSRGHTNLRLTQRH